MKLEQSFTVAAPPQQVYETLLDIGQVAPCLPGADISEDRGDGSWAGSFTVKLGPTTAAYTGTLKVEERDDAARSATLAARGQDRRGQGGATAKIVSVVHEDPGGARVDVVTDYSITGRLARFGRGGMVQDVANRLLRDFAGNLQAMLAAEGVPAPAADGGDRPRFERAPAPLGPPGGEPGAPAPPPPSGPEDVTPAGLADAPGPSPAAPAQGAIAAGGDATSGGAGAAAGIAGSGAPRRPAAKPVGGFSLLFRALLDRLRRMVGRAPR